MPKKPSKYGIKINCLVDVDTAYLLFSEVYLGKADPTAAKETDFALKLVKRLSYNYLRTNRCITMDNFFTSVLLAKYLYTNGIRIIGTLRKNKVNFLFECFCKLIH